VATTKGDSFSNASASADFIVGFVEVASTREHCFALTADVPFKEFRVKVTSLVVDSGHRRKGIASLLLSACARQSLIWSGCTELFLEVRNENQGARLFYDKMGFKECLGESCSIDIFNHIYLTRKLLSSPLHLKAIGSYHFSLQVLKASSIRAMKT
jgi:Acetyltransferase (GNAT) family